MLIQDWNEKIRYMFCDEAELLITMHPVRRLAIIAKKYYYGTVFSVVGGFIWYGVQLRHYQCLPF